jgi:hypothetical protein
MSDANVKVPLLVNVADGINAMIAFNEAVRDAVELITEVPPRAMVPGPLIITVDAEFTVRSLVIVKVFPVSIVRAGVL